jgi:hypothetical protein
MKVGQKESPGTGELVSSKGSAFARLAAPLWAGAMGVAVCALGWSGAFGPGAVGGWVALVGAAQCAFAAKTWLDYREIVDRAEWTPAGLVFEASGRRFAVPWAQIREVGAWRFRRERLVEIHFQEPGRAPRRVRVMPTSKGLGLPGTRAPLAARVAQKAPWAKTSW